MASGVHLRAMLAYESSFQVVWLVLTRFDTLWLRFVLDDCRWLKRSEVDPR